MFTNVLSTSFKQSINKSRVRDENTLTVNETGKCMAKGSCSQKYKTNLITSKRFKPGKFHFI